MLETFINNYDQYICVEKVLELLKKWNPWEKEIAAGIRREEYLKKILPYVERREVLALKGIRRSGKSTILLQIMEELLRSGIENKQILYLNLEEYGFADSLTPELFEVVLNTYLAYSKNKRKTYFFIDEIQKIKGWERWVRTQYDRGENIKFIVSGSSASLLSKELSTLLTGRNISFTILPLSFREFVQFTKEEDLTTYLVFGGFPEVVLEPSKEKKERLLQQYFEDITHKDIIDRYNVRNTKQVLDLARYLVSTSGAKVSVNKLSRVFGIAKDTLQSYMNYMLDAFLISEVPFFSYSAKGRHDVSKLPKLYCVDLGFVYITNTTRSKNRGQLFENAVFGELLRQSKEICYWSDQRAEVDFVTETTAINVTATNTMPAREKQGLEMFNKKSKGHALLIISDSLKKENIVPLKEFLLTEMVSSN